MLALQPDCAIVNARYQHRSPIKSISIKGWVAQLVEQWTENLVFAPRDVFAASHSCEHERTVMTTNDRGTVNMASTGRPFARARECHN